MRPVHKTQDFYKKELDKVVNIINNKPIKSLGFKMPAEVFYARYVALQN